MRLFFNVLCVLILWHPSHAEEREGVEVQRLRFDDDRDGREDRIVVRLRKLDPKNALAAITIDADYGIWSEAFTKRYRYIYPGAEAGFSRVRSSTNRSLTATAGSSSAKDPRSVSDTI